MLYVAKFTNGKDKYAQVFDDFSELEYSRWCKENRYYYENCIFLTLSTEIGKEHKRKKAYELAQEIMDVLSEYRCSLGDLSKVKEWFYDVSKKYDLIDEFTENGVC